MRLYMIAGLLFFVGGQTFAQTESRSTMPSMVTGASEIHGLTLGISKPLLDIKLKGSADGDTHTEKADMENVYGLSVGYKSLSVGQLGFTTGLSYIMGEVEDVEGDSGFGFMRIEGNGAYSINEMAYIKGGLNMSKLIKAPSNVEDKIDEFGFGLQFGAGLQINRTLSVDLQYVSMAQEGSSDGVSLDLEQNGFEFGLNATF